MFRNFQAIAIIGCLIVIGIFSAAQTTDNIIASGEFQTIDPYTPTAGTYQITRNDDELKLLFLSNFNVAYGPDLHVLLSPKELSVLNNKNATEGALVVSILLKRQGSQSYKLPTNLDLSGYKSVLVHCIKYSHLYGGATLVSKFANRALAPTNPSAASKVIASDNFVTIDPGTPTSGTYQAVVVAKSGIEIRLLKNFRVVHGPDLHVILSSKELGSLNNKNALEGALIVSLLKKLNGSQTYVVPQNTDLRRYKSVIIYCVRYTHLFGGAKVVVNIER